MPRPRSSDPSVAVTLRLPASVLAVWEKRAAKKGVPVRKHLQDKLVEAAGGVPVGKDSQDVE